MTELQILRNALFDEIGRIKRGTSTQEDVVSLAKISNCIIQSYNTELKATSLLITAKEKSFDTIEVKVFDDSPLQIETKGRDDEFIE